MSPPRTAEGFESPSLGPCGVERRAAYELKFLIEDRLAAEVETWSRRALKPDPHGQSELGGAYRTTSLYFDTPELDVYHRSPKYRRRKFRARRYGLTSWVYLERKRKSGDRVSKRRVVVPESDLARLAVELGPEDWAGRWCHRRIAVRRLMPACRLAYSRTAYAGVCPEGPIRLTLDREIRGILSEDWRLEPFEGGIPILSGRVILELKFVDAVPLPFKSLMQDLRLTPKSVSKYRLCREAWGAVTRAVPGPLRGEVSSA